MSSIASSGIRLSPRKPEQVAPRPPLLDWSEVRRTLRVLAWPALLLAPMVVAGEAPVALQYLLVATIVLVVGAQSFRTPEPLLATTLLYIPLARSFQLAMLPGLNGTNILLLMLLFFWRHHARRRREPMWRKLPGTGLVLLLLGLGLLSGVTVMVRVGPAFLLGDLALDFKAWLEQFVFFFAFANLIANGAMARRLVVYMALGVTIAVVLGLQEMFAKQDVMDYELRRVFGPHIQPNDFGAFLVYAMLIPVAWLAVQPLRWRRWLMLPWLALLARVLIATGSRGAWLALAAGVSTITWLRGMRYVVMAVVAVTVMLTAFPQLIPASVRERLEQTQLEANVGEQVDTSSTHRLLLWQAGLEMTLENPILGKGFKGFQHYKGAYVPEDVRESDPHNMFLYFSAQMGVPAMLVFVAWLGTFFVFGYTLWRKGGDELVRAIGLAGAAMVLAIIGVNLFGSRMVNASTTLYAWVFFAVLAWLFQEQQMPRRRRAVPVTGSGPRAVPPARLREQRVQRERARRRSAMTPPADAPRGDIRLIEKKEPPR